MHPQFTPNKHREIKYRANHQLSPVEETSPAINAAGVKIIQETIGALLYYTRAIDTKLLVALSAIGSQQAAATEDTTTSTRHLLDYVATYPNDGIIYRSRNMVLSDHADAGFHN